MMRRVARVGGYAVVSACVWVALGCGDDDGAAGPDASEPHDVGVPPRDAGAMDATPDARADAGSEGGATDAGPDRDAAPSAPCDGLDAPGPALLVRTVSGDGRPVLADRVRWLDAELAEGLWIDATEAVCADDATAPCAEWVIDGDALPDRILVTADVYRDGETVEGRPTCVYYATSIAQVRALDATPRERQVLSLVLPDDAAWCDDGPGGSVFGPEGSDAFHAIEEGDCLVTGDPGGTIAVTTTDLDGALLPAARVVWYYPPDSPSYDGEHPLVCADTRCTRWRVIETPASGMLYFAASAVGPTLPPFYGDDMGWSGSGATPAEHDGAELEVTVAIEMSFFARPDEPPPGG